MRRLRNIRLLGRYKHLPTGKEWNVYKGNDKKRGTDHIFYLKSGKREYITDADFYNKEVFKKISDHKQ